MATLTSDLQYLGRSAKMSPKSEGYGYYILLYGKTEANTETGIHTVTIEERIACTIDSRFYNYGSSYNGTINGQTVFSGSREPSSDWELGTFSAGGYTYKRVFVIATASLEVDATDGLPKSIPISCSWEKVGNSTVDYVPANGTKGVVSVTVDLPAIPRASAVSATDAYIESVSTIFINKVVPSYTHTISYKMAGQDAYTTIVEKTPESQYPWKIPDEAYYLIPSDRSIGITIRCETFDGESSRDYRETEIIATAAFDRCKPLISATAYDVNETTLELTGDPSRIVKGVSNVKVVSDVSAQKGASLESLVATDGSKSATETSLPAEIIQSNLTIEGAQSASISVLAKDSRRYAESYAVEGLSLVEYIPLTVNTTIQRESPGSDVVNIEVSGNYFNGNFGEEDNTISVKVRSKVINGEYGEDIDLSVTTYDKTYNARGTINLPYSNMHDVEIIVSDKAMVKTETVQVQKGSPEFYWTEDFFRFRVPAVIQSESPLTIEGTGTTDAAINTEIYSYAAAMNDGYFKFVYIPAVSHSLLGGDPLLVECFKIGNEDFAIWLKVSSISQLPYVKVYVANYQKTVGWIGWTSLNGVTPATYVTSEYTSGIWTVRRWSNNVAELWGRYTATVDIKTTWVSNVMYYAPNAIPSQNFPVTFKSVPFIQVTPAGVENAYLLCTNSDGDNPSTTKTGAWQVCAPYGRNGQGIDVSFYVRGAV